MTNWYRAYCPEHGEACAVFVCSSSSGVSAVYPDEAHREAVKFLADHYGCRLELVRDDQRDLPPGVVDRTPP